MITLKHGKFFNNGEPMPIEFGNSEQIHVLNRSRSLFEFGEEMDMYPNGDGKNITGFYHGIRCLCGHVISFKTPDRIDKAFMPEKKSCSCGIVYQSYDDDDLGYSVKAIKVKKK